MSQARQNLSKDDIKKAVSQFYGDVAAESKSVEGSTEEVALSVGYSAEDLASVPQEANLGLGCGNPAEKALPQQGEYVVDLGCGRGFDVFLAARKVGSDGRVIGVDMTWDMIDRAREIALKRGFDNVEFRLGEIEYLPLGDNWADLVMSNCVINLSADKPQVYREMYRVLRRGGRLGISDIVLTEPLPQEILDDPRMYGT